MDDDDADALLRLERTRCEAISAGDLAAVEKLLATELTHTHASGVTEDKATYLEGLRGQARQTTRGDDLRVRLYGDVAVMTGTLRNSYAPAEPGGQGRTVELLALQVWVRRDGGWQQVAYATSGRPRS
jgi:hypothetical protein